MKITKKEFQEVEVTADIICNKCGESCRGSIGNFNGLIEAIVDGTYDSTDLEDGGEYQFSLCEKCLKPILDSFKHSAYQGNQFSPEKI